jgi:circadian clock protein KaiB
MSKKITGNNTVKAKSFKAGGKKYVLRLYISGTIPNSARAVVNIKAICENYLKNRYELEIIDIYQHPALASTEEIVAVPLLIKKFPLPEERMVGDLSNTEEVLKGLSLEYT